MSQLLMMNSRFSYRDLSDRVGLSVNAVHKRVRDLKDLGIIRAFTANVSLAALKAIGVFIFGSSGVDVTREVHDRLRNNDSTFWVAFAGGSYVYVGAYLQDVSQLEPYVAFVKKEAYVGDPVVGIANSPFTFSKAGRLSTLDYQIINALRRDSRKPVLDLAEQLGVSVKTARRRLTRMIQEGLIELSLEWYPDASNDVMTIFHVQLRSSADKADVQALLTHKYGPSFFNIVSFSNLPNLLLCWVWTNTMKELRDVMERLQKEEAVESFVPNILYTGYIFETWRDRLVMEKGVFRK